MEIWEELKILSFTRTIVAVYSSALLALFLRVQLNVLGGYMYRSSQVDCTGKGLPVVEGDTQKQYLALVQYLFEQGISDLIALVRGAVIKEIGSCSLKDSLTAANVSSIVAGVRQRIEGTPRNGCSPRIRGGDLGRFVMAPIDETPDEACGVTRRELLVRQLEDETRDVIQSADFNVVLTSCLDSSFFWLANRTAEYFKPVSGFNGAVRTAEGAMPLAKVIPIFTGLVHTVLADQPNPLVQELLLREQVKDFAVNVYDAFCEVPPGCALSG